MKKKMALLFAMLMLFTLSLAAAEDTFTANVGAFLSGLDFSEHDVLASADIMGQKWDAQLGWDDAGIHGILSMAGTEMGEVMITSDAAYISSMGEGSKVQFATVADYVLGILQIPINDVQMLVTKVSPYLMDFAGVFSTEEIKNGTRFVIDSTALSETLTKAIDGILLDEEVAACIDRYPDLLKLLGPELHAEDIQNAWKENKEQIRELFAGSEMSLTLNHDQKYDLKVLFTRDDEKAGLLSNGFMSDRQLDSLTTIGVVGQEPEVRIAMNVDDGGIMFDMKAEDVTIQEQIVLEDDQLKSVDCVVTRSDTAMIDLHYAGDHFSMKFSDVTVDADLTVREAKHVEAVATVRQDNSEIVIYAVADLQDDALVIMITNGESPVVFTLTETEKRIWNDLSKDESMVEVTKEMINEVMTSLVWLLILWSISSNRQ